VPGRFRWVDSGERASGPRAPRPATGSSGVPSSAGASNFRPEPARGS
jgi:hypothetical protein